MAPSAPFRALLAFTLLVSTLALAADGRTLLEQGRFRQLYGAAQERLQHNSNDPEAFFWLSAVYDANGDFDRALDYARRATEAAPDNSDYHCQYADVLGDKALKAGVLGGGAVLAHQMRHELDRSLELDPRNIRCLRESMGLYEQAPILIGGSKAKARQALQQIYDINQAEGARSEAALLQMQKRPVPEIELYLRRAVQLNPHFYRALIDLDSVLASDGYRHWSEVEHFSRQAIAADPQRAAAYAYLAGALVHLQHWSDLDAALEEAQRQLPDNALPLYSAALALLDSATDLPRAERYLRRYLAQEPEAGTPTPALAHWKLALVLEKQGRLAEAATELRAAAAENSADPAFKKDFKRIAG